MQVFRLSLFESRHFSDIQRRMVPESQHAETFSVLRLSVRSRTIATNDLSILISPVRDDANADTLRAAMHLCANIATPEACNACKYLQKGVTMLRDKRIKRLRRMKDYHLPRT